ELAEEAEREATTALEQAKREREKAEKNLPALARAAEAAVKQQEAGIDATIKVAEQELEQGLKLAKLEQRPPHEARKLARSWLLGGTVTGDSVRTLVAPLAALDPAIGHFN